MGTITNLADRRDLRAREREAARVNHPSMRWTAGAAFWTAHARAEDGTAECGARGPLTLATPGTPLCVVCFPPAERAFD